MTRRPANMFVCIRLDLFDWVTHTRAPLPRRGDAGRGWGRHAYTRTTRQMSRTHARPKGKATLCKQIAGVSADAVPLGYKAGVCHNSHHCVLSTRSDVDCSVKLPGNRPRDYSITHTYWWV